MKLLVDLSSIVTAYMYIKDEEYGVDRIFMGKTVHIPDIITCMDSFKVTVSNLEIEPKDFIVVKDPVGDCMPRKKILTDYKKRKDPPFAKFIDARKALLDEATKWLRSMGSIIATPLNRTEADDLLNQLAIRLPETIIWTRDKDMLACPTDVWLQGINGIEINPKKFPVEDKYIPLYRAIVTGDPADNVKGVKGFGAKAWEDMVDHFDEGIIKELGEIAEGEYKLIAEAIEALPKLQLIQDQIEKLKKTYKVLQFFPVPAHQIKWEGGVLEGKSTLVTSHNYQQVMTWLGEQSFEYAVIDYETDVCDESREWSESSGVKVDVMGSRIAGMGLRINERNFYFCVDHADTYNITIDQLESVLELIWGKKIYAHNCMFENTLTHNHFGVMLPNMVDTQMMASYVDENDFVGLKHLSKKWLKYDQQSYDDTLAGRSGMREVSGAEVVGYGIDDVITTDGLANLFTVILQYEGTFDVFNKVENDALYYTTLCFINGVDFDEVKFKEMKKVNDENIERVWKKFSKELIAIGWEGGEPKGISNMNIRTLNTIHKAVHGVNVKSSSVKKAIEIMDDRYLAEIAEKKDYVQLNMYYMAHWKPEAEFNVRSFVQVSKLLYEFIGIEVRIRNKLSDTQRKKMKAINELKTESQKYTPNRDSSGRRLPYTKIQGNPASNEAAIKNAIAFNDCPQHVPLLELLLEYKGYLTRESLFFAKWPDYVHWETGKIHCSMRQSSTTTRRFSHAQPNMAQLPKRKGKEVRDMMTVPDDDWFIWAFDIDSQELKLQAWASQDENFLACYTGEDNKDVHSMTGHQVALQQGHKFASYEDFEFLYNMEKSSGVKDPEIVSYRALGKATNFATAYLCRPKKLSQMLCVTQSQAEDFIQAKADAFPGLMFAITDYNMRCKNRKYSTTFLGARRHLHGKSHYKSKQEFEVEAADRLAWSFNIQGSAAEQIKLSAGAMYREGLFDDGKVMPITVIHDELVGIIHKSVLEERMPIMHKCICLPYADMALETSSSPEIGSHFGSLKEWKGEV